MTRRLRVLIADDHAPTRAEMSELLERDGFEVCAEVATAPAAVAEAERLQPDICLLDIRMPGNGIAAVREIAVRAPEAAMVMLTVSQAESDLFDALRAGAIGYLPKEMDPMRIPAALRGVVGGEAALPRRLAARVVDEFRAQERRRVRLKSGRSVQLTAREWEILELLRDGLGTGQIADRLFVSPVTVRTHIAAIVKKFRVRDRAAAVRALEPDRRGRP